MKDAANTKTMDMISTEKKRGRPKTGKAKTAAQRKREQRLRDRHTISNAFANGADWSTITTSALCDELRNCTENGYAGLAAHIMEKLAERAIRNEEDRFTREKNPKFNNYKTFITVTRKLEEIKPDVTVTEKEAEAEIPVTVTKSKAAPKYRSAKGQTWSGRGQRPRWVQNHIDQGGTLADLLL